MGKLKLFILFIILLNIFVKNSYAKGPGSIVYDPTNAANMKQELENSAKDLEYQADMLSSIGKGDLNPSVVNYMDNAYSSCGGKKYGLPNWFPGYDIPEICADEDVIMESVVKDYKDKMLPLTTDTPEEAAKKRQYRLDNSAKVRGYALGKSQLVLDKTEQTSKTIENLMKDAKNAKTQIEVQKIQLQVSLATLQEIQKMNETQALILQVMGWKN